LLILRTFPLELFGLLVLLALSGFFSAAETALFSLSREQIRRLEREPTAIHRAIVKLTADSQAVLATVLSGNVAVNTLYFSVSYFVVLRTARDFSSPLGTLLGAVFFILLVVFGEVAPKGVAVRRPLAVSHMVAVPLLYAASVLTPVRVLLTQLTRWIVGRLRPRNGHTRAISAAELKLLLNMSQRQGVLDRNASRTMAEVIDSSEVMLKEVMRPRVDMVAFDIAAPREAFVELVRQTHHSHIPVYDGSIDNIVGVVHVRDVLLHPDEPLTTFVRPVLFVPGTKSILAMLRDFRAAEEKTAIVVDEYGGTAGLVTLEDILEQIVGEIHDEFDREQPPVIPQGDNVFLVAANLGTREWADYFPVVLDSSRTETVGGFVVSLLGHWPRPGDSVVYRGLRFTVADMQGLRIRRIRVEAVPEGVEMQGAQDHG